LRKLLAFALLAAPATFADPVADVFDGQVSTIEREVLALAQAMPANKYDFAPTNGTFTGVRTYALQVRHIATIMYQIAASVSGEKIPVDIGTTDNGPDSLKTKDQIIDYFKGAIAFAHKAMRSMSAQNQLDQVPSPFGRGTQSRLQAAAFLGLHTFDHYGQMVEYARMNGIVPGANIPPPGGTSKNKR
jgi:hypothetical protein